MRKIQKKQTQSVFHLHVNFWIGSVVHALPPLQNESSLPPFHGFKQLKQNSCGHPRHVMCLQASVYSINDRHFGQHRVCGTVSTLQLLQ
mmetsp:Transcript_17119/g.26693  ORF Transcript_17119/g.26693 Transcript_17119/m.26693 type:complete len:89 (+) Transcript_17119:229-495(+)